MMKANIDGAVEFEQTSILVGSLSRDRTDISVAGLDGVVSIDGGLRSRSIKQQGIVRAVSREQLDLRVGLIESFIDDSEHILTCEDGTRFNHIRVDSVVSSESKHDGAGVSCVVEIEYSQLRY